MNWNKKYNYIDKEERAKVLVDSILYVNESIVHNRIPIITMNISDIRYVNDILDTMYINEKIKYTIINTLVDITVVQFIHDDIKTHNYIDIIHNGIAVLRLKLQSTRRTNTNHSTIIQVDVSKYVRDLEDLYNKIDKSIALCNIITYGSMFGLFMLYLFLSPR